MWVELLKSPLISLQPSPGWGRHHLWSSLGSSGRRRKCAEPGDFLSWNFVCTMGAHFLLSAFVRAFPLGGMCSTLPLLSITGIVPNLGKAYPIAIISSSPTRRAPPLTRSFTLLLTHSLTPSKEFGSWVLTRSGYHRLNNLKTGWVETINFIWAKTAQGTAYYAAGSCAPFSHRQTGETSQM